MKTMNQPEIFEAIVFAAKAHSGQYRKGTVIPYIYHPLAVARLLIENHCSEEIVITGLLHDTIEDTTVTFEQIAEKFGQAVAEMVQLLTDPPDLSTWLARKKHILETLSHAPQAVLLVALADKLDNLRAIGKDQPQVWQRFKADKEQIRWYYKSLADLFLSRSELLAGKPFFEEFIETVRQVFPEAETNAQRKFNNLLNLPLI